MWLIDTIRQSGYITFEELDRRWRRSRLNINSEPLRQRTFFNHKCEILNQLGIDIRYKKGAGYYIGNEEDLGSNRLRNWMLSSIAANTTVQESRSLSSRIIIEDIPAGLQYLNTIIEAMKNSQVLSITYRRFEDVEDRILDIDPYCLKLFHQRWYVLGRNCKDGRHRLYSLDRISEVRLTTRKFTLPRNFDAKTFFDDYFGVVIDETPSTRIRLKVWDPHRRYIRALPLHEPQAEEDIHEDWSIFTYRMAPTWDLAMELMKYHDMVEVLEPESLRDQIIDMAYCILDLYGEHTPGGDFKP